MEREEAMKFSHFRRSGLVLPATVSRPSARSKAVPPRNVEPAPTEFPTIERGRPRQRSVSPPSRRTRRRRAEGAPRADVPEEKRRKLKRELADERRAGRKSRRARQKEAAPHVPGVGFLRQSSVQTRTLVGYQRVFNDMLCWWRRRGSKPAEGPRDDQLDGALSAWMEEAFLEGEQPEMGARLEAAAKFFRPNFGKGGTSRLPLARQTLRGWRRRNPAHVRPLLPFEVVLLISSELVRQGFLCTAVYCVLTMICYLRPSEAFTLREEDLVPPLEGSRHRHWAIVLHAFETGEVSKTLDVDEVVLVDNPDTEWLDQALAFLKRITPRGQRLFTFTQTVMGKRFRAAAASAGVSQLKPEPYQLRHTGPSHDYALKHRSIGAIKDRGRWMSDASVKRYKKEGRVGQQLATLDPSTRRRALAAARVVAGMFEKPSAAPWPARADRASRRSY